MLYIENINFELPQMGKEPKAGYSEEYIEKTMISGKIKRISKGKRLALTFSYAYLTNSERETLDDLLDIQRQQGYLSIRATTPYGLYVGQAIMDINNDQSRFTYSTVLQDYVWTDWRITFKAVKYDS